MPIDHSETWYLRKHDNGEIFGPVRFEQIRAWARAAQVNPQDVLSTDKLVWTKAPMFPELEMDWLIEVSENLLYGPTTSGALLEFVRIGEITRATHVVNCCTGEKLPLGDAPFFSEEAVAPVVEAPPEIVVQPKKGGVKVSLQQRVRDLEASLIEKRLQLNVAKDAITKLEARVRELEAQLRDIRTGRR